MFNIDAKPTFTIPITVSGFGPEGEDGGEFSLTFRARTLTEYEGYDLTTGAGTKQFLVDTVISGDGFVDDSLSPVQFTTQLFERLIDWSAARRAIMLAYHAGLAKAAEGN